MRPNIAQALAEFMGVLIENFGKPITIGTISAFSKMVGEIAKELSSE